MFDFPSSPTVGQRYPASPIAGLPQYAWDGEKWGAPGQPSTFADAPSDGFLYGRRNAAWLATDARQQIGQCKLQYVSASQLILLPYNGNSLKINGVINAVPAAGVVLANTGLVAGNYYRIYAWMNAGVMTLEASATGHATSSAAGNIGTEIKSGDNTRTLVGLVYMFAGTPGQFQDSLVGRGVRSWFNDNGVVGYALSGTNTPYAGAPIIELDGAVRAYVLRWASEQYFVTSSCQCYNSVPYANMLTAILLDGAVAGNQVGGGAYFQAPAAANQQFSMNANASGVFTASDLLSFFTLGGSVDTGTGQFATKSINVMTVRR